MALAPPPIPPRIARLDSLAHNLWWSWDRGARELFKTLDPRLWKLTHHNPVRLLRELPPQVLEEAASDEEFLGAYDSVLATMAAAALREGKWFAEAFPSLKDRPVAYFSAEFGLHSSLPIYSGGLGILAGDKCKESSDLGVPLLGVGFVYPQGYFHQRLRSDGWQENVDQRLERDASPIQRAVDDRRFLVQLQLNEETIHFGVWQVLIGGVSLYLMDTDVEENEPQNRDLSARLYGGDREHRIRQEIVLGIGGVRTLRALGVAPELWHANEGIRPSCSWSGSGNSFSRGIPSSRRPKQSGKVRYSRHTLRCGPDTIRFPSTWSRSISVTTPTILAWRSDSLWISVRMTENST